MIFAHAAALKDKYALEEQELILRRKKEPHELDTEIAATTAKLAALQVRSSITSQHASVTSQQSDGMESYFRKAPAHLSQSACLKMHASVCKAACITFNATMSLNAKQRSTITENITCYANPTRCHFNVITSSFGVSTKANCQSRLSTPPRPQSDGRTLQSAQTTKLHNVTPRSNVNVTIARQETSCKGD